MQSEDRLIHFSTELLYPPVRHKVPVLQRLYYELSQTRAAYDSSEFSTPPQFKFYSRRPANAQSLALFLPDRLVLIEEWADLALSDFLEKVKEVGGRTLSCLGIPLFVAQTATLRSTFALTHFEDARAFLLDHACGQVNRITPHFQRPIAVGGLRFVLPETPEHPGTFHVVIESFKHSVKEVFVEVKGIFGNLRLDTETLGEAVENIRAVRAFICERVFPYLNQYDVRQEVP
jgi:hypothetical protein